jgi:hypothetical protein
MTAVNLNELGIPTDGAPEAQGDHGISAVAKIDVIFRNQRARLIDEIQRSAVVIGCVAWLTDNAVLQALARCEHVSIVVQKEDFLRPDLGYRGAWAQNLRQLYGALPSPLTRYDLPGGVAGLSYACDPSIAPVRCVGNHNRDKKAASPRMHNKFLVFCEHRRDDAGNPSVVPRRVWTGSYNISANAAASWENAVLIHSAEVADAYAREYGQIMAFSEVLDWTNDWVAPEYRIGT